ncbi:Altronate oxidoreductase [Aequoribacter fuscus]|uniref:Altronate oxidoreductase n=1 Tax=Aequoribacter fuscus TaxID=2518989 RepID=F3KZ94_9GAMM|nr:tagaturonate reductase [Aequoribacter fuscus]EGG30581.1 Altronate oxidoreductase [Aequoribacter fuscus]QHJ87478.1 tagaturonate reductase [Aequoribacter fuscus]
MSGASAESIDRLKSLNRSIHNKPRRPIKVVQFGTGAFLHGFVDWIVNRVNQCGEWNAGVASVKLRAGKSQSLDALMRQDGLYHVNCRGINERNEAVDAIELIDTVQSVVKPHENFIDFLRLAQEPELEWIVSNSTEAGLVFIPEPFSMRTSAQTFPGQLTQFLYQRYRVLGDTASDLVILPCELLDNNAQVLKDCIHNYIDCWGLESAFSHWLKATCEFCSTIVDRIVTGNPANARTEALSNEIGTIDDFIIEAEYYHLWGIQASGDLAATLSSRFAEAKGLNVHVVDDLDLLRKQKVRVLNGVHTATVLLACYLKVRTVSEAMQHPLLRAYMGKYWSEVVLPSMPSFSDVAYISSIAKRFENPFLEHEWQSIVLNSFSKWRVRLLPVLIDLLEQKEGRPEILLFSLALLLEMYISATWRNPLGLTDNEATLSALAIHELTWDGSQRAWQDVLSDTALWGQTVDLPLRWIALLSDFSAKIQRQEINDTLTFLASD